MKSSIIILAYDDRDKRKTAKRLINIGKGARFVWLMMEYWYYSEKNIMYDTNNRNGGWDLLVGLFLSLSPPLPPAANNRIIIALCLTCAGRAVPIRGGKHAGGGLTTTTLIRATRSISGAGIRERVRCVYQMTSNHRK